jgi:hypothetical protein
MSFLIPFLYALFFLGWMKKSSFFRDSGLSFTFISSVFVVKIGAGLLLTYIYTYFYTDATTSDLFLYYKDGKIISDALKVHPSDGIRMLLGIGDSSDYFFKNYYSKMERWNRFHDAVFFNDCRLIIRFDACVQLISFGAFHAGTVIINFLSCVGLVAMYRCWRIYFRQKEILLAFSLFCIPALLFWASAMLKEGLLVFSVGCFLYGFFEVVIHRKFVFSTILFLVIGLFFSLLVKVYFLILLFPALLSYWLVFRRTSRFKLVFFALVYCSFIMVGFLFCVLLLERNPARELIQHQHAFINVSKGGVYLYRDSIGVRLDYVDKERIIFSSQKDIVHIQKGSSYVQWNNLTMSDTVEVILSSDTSAYWHSATLPPATSAYTIPPLRYSFSSFIRYAPSALFNSFFRPFPTECKNAYQWFCSLENIFCVFMIFLSLFFIRYRKTDFTFFLLFFSFVISLLLILGYTTPVSGALVRYKAPLLPFLLIAFFALTDVEKLQKISWFTYLNKKIN